MESDVLESDRITLLKNVPVFGAIREDVIGRLINQAPIIDIHQGEYLFREGDASTSMYVIEAGQVAVVKRWANKEYLLKHLDYGDCIGEMALFDFLPRSASVVAVQDAKLIEITSANLLDIYDMDLEQFTLIQMNLGREVTRRLRDADEQLFQERIQAAIHDGSVTFHPDGLD